MNRAWDLDTTVYVLSGSSQVPWSTFHKIDERRTKDVDNIAFSHDLTTFIACFSICFHDIPLKEERLTPHLPVLKFLGLEFLEGR